MKKNSDWQRELTQVIKAKEILKKFPGMLKNNGLTKQQLEQINCAYPIGLTPIILHL